MKRTIKFWTQEEINEMLELINDSTINMHSICLKLAEKYERTHNAIKVKMYQLRRDLKIREELMKTVKVKSKVNSKINLHKIEQQPAEVGIEVPHGMTFEGTPKKIMLHSDHFRIYF